MPVYNCVKFADNQYVGQTTLSNIRANLMDPMRIAKSTDPQRVADHDLRRAWDCRGPLQRAFNKARIQRAVDYGNYINGIANGRAGGYPPITLWTSEGGDYDPVANTLTLPGGAVITASDGETQLAARFMLVNGFAEKGYLRPIAGDSAWLDVPFAFTLTTNSSTEAAMQVLHDTNHYASPVSESETAPLNIEGMLTKAVNAGITASKLDRKWIKGRGIITSRSSQYTSMLLLLHGTIGVANGAAVLLSHTPNRWIHDGNTPFATTNGKEQAMVDFVQQVLAIPPADLRQIGADHMMALGVHFGENKTLSKMSFSRVAQVVSRVKSENGGRRVTTRKAATAIFEEM